MTANKTLLEISYGSDQPFSLATYDSTGRIQGAKSHLEAYNEDEAKEELRNDYGFSINQIEEMFA